jgi:acetyltransferase-like isoleucine patch superfamily enzyme
MKTGKNCKISNKISVFNDDIVIGENVRIDDFCLLSGHITIGSHIHIAAGNYFYGGSGIVLHDFAQVAPGCLFISESDDFSGDSMVGPQVPMAYKPHYKRGLVTVGDHVVIGAKSMVFPGVTIGAGSAIGAFTMVRHDIPPWTIIAGGGYRAERSREILELSEEFLEEYDGRGRS